MLTEFYRRSKELGLQINPSKAKGMTNSTETPIVIDGMPIQNCSDYMYLGQSVSLTVRRTRKYIG